MTDKRLSSLVFRYKNLTAVNKMVYLMFSTMLCGGETWPIKIKQLKKYKSVSLKIIERDSRYRLEISYIQHIQGEGTTNGSNCYSIQQQSGKSSQRWIGHVTQ